MGKSSIDINGYRRQEANPISMVGVFPYTGKQIDYDGSLRLDPHKIYWVLRPPEELFHPDAIKSFNGLPIRIGHVMLGTGFKSVDEEPVDGCIFNVRQSMDMPDYLIGDFSIYTDKMKDVLAKGRIKELSLGYRCQYIPETGVYNGQPYEFKQANLRGNHLALVENGRCGSSVRVCDEAILTFDSLPEEIINMKNQEKLEKAKRFADAVRNADNTVCEDCLDFMSYARDDRMEVLAALAAKKAKKDEKKEEPKEEPKAEDAKAKDEKKDDGEVVEQVKETVVAAEPTAEDGCKGKKEGGKAKDEIPPPPPPEEKEPAKEPAPEAEPVPAKEPAPSAEPAPAKEPAPAPAPEKEPAPVAAEPTKDGCDGTVTTPSIPAPLVGKLDGTKETEKKDEKKDAPKTEDAKVCDKCGKTMDECKCGKEEPKAEDGKEEPCKDGLCKKDKSKDGTCDGEPKNEPKAEDGKGGITKEPMGGKTPFPEKEETFGESNTAMDGVSPEVFARVAAECDRARKLAIAVGQMGVTVDSAGKREIEVAREAVKQIPSLAFAVDFADDAILATIRGAVAARADELARARKSVVTLVDNPSVAEDAAPKAPTSMDVDAALKAYYK